MKRLFLDGGWGGYSAKFSTGSLPPPPKSSSYLLYIFFDRKGISFVYLPSKIAGADLEGGCRGFLIQLVLCQKKKAMWFIGVEVEQETSAPPPKKNPGSAPEWVPL